MKNYSLSKGIRAMAYSFILGVSLLSSSISANNILDYSTVQQQPSKITGTITDGVGPLPGVTIAVKGKSLTAISDYNGEYLIAANPSDVLVFSFMGFKTVEIRISLQKIVNVELKEDATALQEVKINAGYYSVKESERTGSIARITADDIEKQPVTNVLATMQGRMAGVNITQTTGVPGGGFEIQIRGQNSIRTDGNAPLYIIDGVPYSTQNLGNDIISGSILPAPGISPLNSINPSDIESIEILKDADATSIYGSRGANGVVLLTTKKGKLGKTAFSINTYSGTAKVTRTLDLMNTAQYLSMREKAFANDGIIQYPSWAYDVNGTWDKNRYTDWQKELIGGTAYTRSIDAAISGGNNTTQFIIRASNFNQTTVFPGDFAYGKTALHFNINHISDNDKFNVSLSGNYSADKNNILGTDLTLEASQLAPNAPALYDDKGELNWENSTWKNPLRLLESKYLAKTNTLVAGSTIGYNIAPSLEFKTTLGYTNTHLDESKTVPSTIYNPAYGLDSSISSFYTNKSGQQSWNVEPQLSWHESFGFGTIKTLAGATIQESASESLGLNASGFSSNSLITNSAAAANVQVLNNTNGLYRYSAIFGRINYSLNDKYFLNITGRRDGSSRFGPDNRFANFGAVGAAWLFARENLITEKYSCISFGKLRGSYGSTGSDQIGDYQFMNTYISSGGSYQGIVGLEPARLYNPDFSWETNKKLEMALELGLLKDRIFITTAHYRNKSSNQLVGIPLPGTTGFPSIQSNLNATVENTGWEFELRTVNFQKKEFRWSTSLNFSVAKNKLLAFPNLAGSTYASQYVIGEPLDIHLVYHFTGINPETGIYQFEDYNDDGTLTPLEDRQRKVSTNPDYFGGLNNSLSYKNWQLDFLFQFVKQLGFNYNGSGVVPGAGNNQPVSNLNSWQPGQTNGVQLYTAGFNDEAVNAYYSYYSYSDAAFSDASFIRLKNLSLSYTLPQSWLNVASCRLYLQGQNLFTITRFNGADPENQSFGKLPPLRVMTMGIQLNF
ncbi:TonB-linked outer membrane protein, SusC/RagA family [Flavobacterium segetis]|uniref:TonB-linked outer membrane protein, SusC/RagA family n=1 Tax=Flavobacterium segetis TaxID=271157 RepID=A0A1M5IGI8_9FLAO|nr:SusC/RagA family TonB-linked outer membrane protein [Flavobacterium segetis]SHG26893.1 TonB-linked outer membrane protein, SusC/RagA family [Flavobacterium segetis]